MYTCHKETLHGFFSIGYTGELGYDAPLYDRFLHMMDDMLGPSPMHSKHMHMYMTDFAYDGPCNFPGPIESVKSKFTCNVKWIYMYNVTYSLLTSLFLMTIWEWLLLMSPKLTA